MKRMTEHEYTIELLEKILSKLSEIEQRLDAQDRRLSRHVTTSHAFSSKGKRYTDQALRDTQIAGRY